MSFDSGLKAYACH